MQKTKGIYLIVGKSGSGKTTLVNELRKYGYTSVESYTTRPKRFKNETGHTFITEEEFDRRMANYKSKLTEMFAESHRLEDEIMNQLNRLKLN